MKKVNRYHKSTRLTNGLNAPVYRTILLKEKYSGIVSTLQPPTD